MAVSVLTNLQVYLFSPTPYFKSWFLNSDFRNFIVCTAVYVAETLCVHKVIYEISESRRMLSCVDALKIHHLGLCKYLVPNF